MIITAEAIRESGWQIVATIASSFAAGAALGVLLMQGWGRYRRFAEPLTAWIEPEVLVGGDYAFRAVVGNAGEAAVYEVMATVTTPGDCFELPLFTVPPNDRRDYQIPIRPATEGGMVRTQDGTIEVRFKDSAGRGWRKDTTGGLHRARGSWRLPTQARDCE